MEKRNLVFIATSLDGFIADPNGGIDWLHEIPNPDNLDMGYAEFMKGIDALVMGRNTFETVSSFEEWPYQKPVFVLSHSLKQLPAAFERKATLIYGKSIQEALELIYSKGCNKLYIDGGKTIQSFLREDLIDEITITLIPKLLGDGIPLFGKLEKSISFECTKVIHFSNGIAQNTFKRLR